MQTRQVIQNLWNKTYFLLAGLALLPLLTACGGGQVLLDSHAQEQTSVAIAQVNHQQPDNFVLIWQVFGTPTPTPSLEPTRAAIRAATLAAQTAAPAPQGGPTAASISATTAPLQPGDPVKGQQVFTGGGGCFACHDTSTGNTIVGPSLKGILAKADSRVAGKTADQYLHESILTPNAFVVQGFTAGIMPQSFSKSLTPQQIEDVIAYLKTLK